MAKQQSQTPANATAGGEGGGGNKAGNREGGFLRSILMFIAALVIVSTSSEMFFVRNGKMNYMNIIDYKSLTSAFELPTVTSKCDDHPSSSSSSPSQSQSNDVESNQEPKKYVVLASTAGVTARPEDYTYIAALSARNWNNLGYTPIIALVGSTMDEIERISSLWRIVLSPESRIIPVLVERVEHHVSVAQVSRLLAASSQLDLKDDDFVRLTDADMMIMDPKPFEALYERPDDNIQPSDNVITSFNGNCCGGQLPMHSVGMRVGLFRSIFPVNTEIVSERSAGEAILDQFYNWTDIYFPDLYNATSVAGHGQGKIWYMDQIILTDRITKDVKDHGYKLIRESGPQSRLHPPGGVTPGKMYTDIHLARFSIKQMGKWLDGFVDKTTVLFGQRKKYRIYTQAWKDQFNITRR